MACMTENSEATPWSMQTEVVSTNLCHFLDNPQDGSNYFAANYWKGIRSGCL